MRLVVVGGGPKAISIAAKAHVLRGLGWSTPDVLILEKQGLAANWDGTNGFTDGKQPLGTPPEKDVGFPYESPFTLVDPSVDKAMLAYSWMAFKVNNGEYSEWVDRGRPRPSHQVWGQYLRWVADRIHADILVAGLTDIGTINHHWRVKARTRSGNVHSLDADALVITGTGEPLRLKAEPTGHHRVFNGRDFWTRLNEFRGLRESSTIGIIGSGETAASIAVALVRQLAAKKVPILVINRQGCLFSRGESYDENRRFSDPSEWSDLPLLTRREIIHRTDRGVFSLECKRILDNADNVQHFMAEVQEIRIQGGRPHAICKERGKLRPIDFDYLINATGFDPLWFVGLMKRPYRAVLSNKKKIVLKIASDLSVKGIHPPLHLPMLSALAQGPGFPNLSCLGLVSDRILASYVKQQGGRRG